MIKANFNKNDNTVCVNLEGDILQLTTELVITIAKINEEQNIINHLKTVLDVISKAKEDNIPLDNLINLFYEAYLSKEGINND